MKLLAVSLVAAASAATNHTAVYGVHPPGLGAVPRRRPAAARGIAESSFKT